MRYDATDGGPVGALVNLVTEMTERQGAATPAELLIEIHKQAMPNLATLSQIKTQRALRPLIVKALAEGSLEVVAEVPRAVRRRYANRDGERSAAQEVTATALTPAMRVVLDALTAASVVHLGPVRVDEVAAFLPKSAISHVAAKARSMWISNVLRKLCERGCVDPRKHGRSYLYTRRGADGPIASAPISGSSARQQVLSLATAAWRRLHRPVRVGDVLAQGWPGGHPAGVERVVAHAMGSLAGTGELARVDRVLGGGVEGSTLYVPGGCKERPVQAREPLSQLEVVAAAFAAAWQQEVCLARQERRRPRPISTRDLRQHIAAKGRTGWPEVNGHEVGMLVGRLAVVADAPIRIAKTGSSSHFLLFAPADVPDCDLDLEAAWVTETERIVEAARRAASRSSDATITQEDVTTEVLADERLKLTGKDAAHALYYLSKETISWQRQRRRPRVRQLVICVGSIAKTNQYVVRGGAETEDEWNSRVSLARNAVAIRQTVHDTNAENLDDEIARAGAQPFVALKVGRLRTVQSRAAALLVGLSSMSGEPALAYLAERARASIAATAKATEKLIAVELERSDCAPLPDDIECTEVGWTAAEFLAEWIKFDASKAAMSPSDVVRQLSLRVRRIPNPDFVAHRYGGRIGAEWLFEKVDARLYLAIRYGGRECNLLAGMVGQALGRLRDPRYMLASGTAKSSAERLRGVAALSFVGGTRVNEMLALLWKRESDPAVQAAILWGCAFNDQPQWREWAASATRSAHPRLRRIGSMLRQVNATAWSI